MRDERPLAFPSWVLRVIFSLVYVWSILWVTKRSIAPLFAYQGYIARVPTTSEVVWAIAATVLFALMSPRRFRRPSDGAFAFLILTVALPVIWIGTYYGPLSHSGLLVSNIAVSLCLIAMRLCLLGGRQPFVFLKVTPRMYWSVLCAVMVLAFMALYLTGLRPRLLGLTDVYSQRADYLDAAGSAGSYVVGWIVNAILPAFVVVGIYLKRTSLFATGILAYLLVFSFTGQKSYLVGMLLSLVAVFLVRRLRGIGTGWVLALTGAVWFGYVMDIVTGSITGTSLLTRRAITTAGINTAYYLQFFQSNPRYELRHSVFGFLGESPYAVPPARLIGQVFYHSNETVANANLVADGYANFGMLGCILTGLVMGLALRMYDRVTSNLPLQVSMPALTLVLVAAANTAVLTVLSTHGGIVLGLTMGVLPLLAMRANAQTEEPSAVAKRADRIRRIVRPSNTKSTA